MEELKSLYFGLTDKYEKIHTRHFYTILVCTKVTMDEAESMGEVERNKGNLLGYLDRYNILEHLVESTYLSKNSLTHILEDIVLMEVDISPNISEMMEKKKAVVLNVLDLLFADGQISDSEKSSINTIASVWNIKEEWFLKIVEIMQLKYSALPFS